MVSDEKTVVWGAILSFLVNFILHAYEVTKALIMIPANLVVTAWCLPFFPVWAIVILGLLKRRKWGFQLGLGISVIGVVVAVGGAVTGLALALVDVVVAFIVDLIQIGFCTYGLRKLKW